MFKHAKKLAELLDSSIRLPGTNRTIGLDGILGLFPGIGDGISTLCSIYIVATAYQSNVPRWTVVRMMVNIAVDSVIGMVPILGDLTDFVWKSNTRNIELWKRAQKTPERTWTDFIFVLACLLGLMLIAAACFYFTTILFLKLLHWVF